MNKNIKLIRIFFLFSGIYLLINLANTELCDKCITPDPENKNGTCVPVRYCKIFYDILGIPISLFPDNYQTFVKNALCSSNDNSENFCCSDDFIDPAFYEPNNKFCNLTIENEKRIGTFSYSETSIPTIIDRAVNKKINIDLDSHPNLSLLPDICGLPGDGDRISNGIEAGLDEYPFMALLQYEINKKKFHACGGTLINSNYVLTAAHCINNNLIGVRLGEHDIDKEIDCEENDYDYEVFSTAKPYCNDPVQDIPIDTILTYNYNSKTKQNDIALLRLERPANITANNVRFVCLPTTAELRNEEIKRANVVGWGITEKGSLSKVLLKGTVNVNQKRKECEKNYKENNKIILNKNYLCAIGERDVDTCRGDSGGPLLTKMKINEESNLRIFQYGIVSAGPPVPCGSTLVRDIGGALYANVPEYMKWILDNIKP